MKTFGRLGLVAAALAVVSMPATAQGRRGGFGGPGGGGMFGGGLFMLRMPEVQKELKMTQPQIDKLETKQQEVGQAMQSLFQELGGPQALQNMSPEERQKAFAKIGEVNSKALSDLLDSTQLKRFRQLELQQQGPGAVLRPEVAAQLKITAEQRAKIEGIQQAQGEAMREAFQGFQDATPEERQKMGEKMAAARKATGEKIVAALTAAQQAAWKEMTGAPFTFPAFGGFGRGPGGGRPPRPPSA